MKVLDFTPKPVRKERTTRLPTEAEMNELLLEKPVKSIILILVNEDDQLAYQFDGVSPMEAIGIMETVKPMIIEGTYEELLDDE